MAARLHSSLRAPEELISLIEGRLSTASGKDALDQAGDTIDCGKGAGRRSRRCDWPEFKARVPAAYHARTRAVVRKFAAGVLPDYGGEKNPIHLPTH